MLNAENLKPLGIFLKTHGVDGQLILKLSFYTEDELVEKEPVFVEIDGIPVPFFLAGFRFVSEDTAILRLDDIDSSQQASELINCRVFIEKHRMTEYREETERSDELKGFRIIDVNHGDLGILLSVIEYPENPVMQIQFNNKEVLVPFHESFIRNINHETRIIKISAPEGLLDLYL